MIASTVAFAAVAACALPDEGDSTVTLPAIAANDNRHPAGRRAGDTLVVELEIARGLWHPEATDGPSTPVLAFRERGGPLQVPAPILRPRAGEIVRVTLTNPFADSTVTVFGWHARPGAIDDTVQVAPGATRTVTFAAGEPGTYFYWAGITATALARRPAGESQLGGAFIVDSAGAPDEPRDRVFVLSSWIIPADSAGPPPVVPRDVMTINGKSWPHTEHLPLALGDTVHWRVVNPTPDAHPMHLHGFYFDATSRGTWAADTLDEPRQAVTELMFPGGTLAMRWIPRVAGNWLFHCHFAFHVSHFLSVEKVEDPADPGAPDAVDHSVHGMRGLVLGLTVRGDGPPPDESPAHARALRLVAHEVPQRYGERGGYGYTLEERGRRTPADGIPMVGPPLLLQRGEPVAITVVNALRAPTAVHWHGMEHSDSYMDGVPGWSGTTGRLAPAIAPGDSFVARFTPPRAGTFIYHSHSNEGHQIGSGLFGAMLVMEPGAPFDSTRDHVVLIGGNGPVGGERGRVNGNERPAPLRLTRHGVHRLRLVAIHPDLRFVLAMRSARDTLQWTPVAKDGADLPVHARRPRRAAVVMGPGETHDVLVDTRRLPSGTRLELRAQATPWADTIPIILPRPRP